MNQILIPWCTKHTFYAEKRNYFAKWNFFIFALISIQNLDFDKYQMKITKYLGLKLFNFDMIVYFSFSSASVTKANLTFCSLKNTAHMCILKQN